MGKAHYAVLRQNAAFSKGQDSRDSLALLFVFSMRLFDTLCIYATAAVLISAFGSKDLYFQIQNVVFRGKSSQYSYSFHWGHKEAIFKGKHNFDSSYERHAKLFENNKHKFENYNLRNVVAFYSIFTLSLDSLPAGSVYYKVLIANAPN